jgi:hypothetical protein
LPHLWCSENNIAAVAAAAAVSCCSGTQTANIRPSDLDLLLSTWLSRNAASAASAGPAGQLLQLQAAFARSPAVSELKSEAARRLVLLLGLRLAARAVRGIEDDEDDLFYDTGRTTQALMQALVRVV